MALEHDASTGFLRGESVAADVEQLAQELKLLRAIESNTSDIAKHLGALSRGRATVQPESVGARRAPNVGSRAANDSGARSGRGTGPRSPGSTSDRSRNADVVTARQPGSRDASGRFVSGGASQNGASASSAASSSDRLGKTIGSSIADAARDGMSKLTADVDNVDPTIQAAKELSGLLSPVTAMFKPLGRLFGRNKDSQQAKEHKESVTWLRRIWRGQADASKGKGGGAGGILGLLMGLLSTVLAPFKALGRVLGIGSALKTAGSLLPSRGGRSAGGGRAGKSGRAAVNGGVDANGVPITEGGKKVPKAGAEAKVGKGGGIKGAAKSAGGGLLKMGKGLLRKLPLIGALFGGAMLASDAMADDDPNLSKEENKKNKWGNVGGGIGGLLGGALGLFGGPAGAIAGGMLGDSLGSAVGEWLSTVDFDKVTGAITDTFSGFADMATKGADAAFGFMKDGWEKMTTIGTSAISGLADWARDTWKAATEKVAALKDNVADKYQTAKDYVGGKVDGVKDAGANLLYKATDGKYGGSGSNAAKDQLIKAMDAGGITNAQSKAALMANVDVESGGFTKKEENLNYSAKRLQEVFPKYYKDADSARQDAGNPEAIANKVYGGRMGNVDPGDGYKFRGRGALQLTGRAQYEEMGKKLGVDLVNNPDLAADPKYSAQIAVQHWKSSGADAAAQAGDITKARKLTNGGTNGLAEVKGKYGDYLAQAQAGDLTPTRRADEMKVAAPSSVNAAVASTMASMASAKTLANAQSVAPIGIMAPKAASAGAVAASAIPTTLAPPRLSMYAPAAADASLAKIPSIAEVKAPPAGGGKDAPPTVSVEMPLTQDVGDRGIAHASTGGLGGWRF